MSTLSICLPSNRNLAQSVQAIENAYNLSQQAELEVVVSDNSNDDKKKELYENRNSESFRYLISPHSNALENWCYALNATKGEYISFLSDDDLLVKLPNSESKKIDPPKNVIGIRPHMALFSDQQGMYNHSSFEICDSRAVDRVKSYFSLHNGANTTIFSFFNGSISKDYYNEFQEAHPTRGAYTDWSTVLGFISMGPLVKSNDFLYIYNNANWYTQAEVSTNIKKAFIQAALPEETAQILPILNALDSYSAICRATSPIHPDEKIEAANYAMTTYFKSFADFILKIETNGLRGFEKLDKAKKILTETVTQTDMLAASLLITDIWLPGYADKYLEYFKRIFDKKILSSM